MDVHFHWCVRGGGGRGLDVPQVLSFVCVGGLDVLQVRLSLLTLTG